MNVFKRFSQMGERSRNSVISVVSSLGARLTMILSALLIVPMTINYVNSTQYGIWLTLSSIIGWVSFFDLGLGNGLRNRFAEAKAKGDTVLARQYVSTTYLINIIISVGLLVAVEIVNCFLDWPSILHIDASYYRELRDVFTILFAFFCLNMVAILFSSILKADQKPGLELWIKSLTQLLALGVIYVLTKTTEGSLFHLAAFYSGIPAIVLLVVSILAFNFTRYKVYAPSLRLARRKQVKDVMGIGIQFFIIYLCTIVIFQMTNIVISREIGPDAVTEYNIAYKYFNLANIVMVQITVPFWSAFTDAFHKDDFKWMFKAKRSLEYIWLCEIAVIVVMTLLSQWFYNIWIGPEIHVRMTVSVAIALMNIFHGICFVYMNPISGIGTIRIQLLVYVFFAIISLPLLIWTCRVFGLVGVIIAPSLTFLIQAVVGRIQLNKLLTKSATGIWAK